MTKKPKIIGVASGLGAPDHRCSEGPKMLFESGNIPCLRDSDDDPLWQEMIEADHEELHETIFEAIVALCKHLSDTITQSINQQQLPIVIGGDHSCAIGTWSGVKNAVQEPIGLIWIDAHMDSHIPSTSPSGAYHGMPLAFLLGLGDSDLNKLGTETPILLPQNVCLLGVRSYEPEEAAILEHLKVKVITMDEINETGIEAAWQQAVAWVTRNTSGYGISIDLDVMDPKDSPGVGSPEANGIRKEDLLKVITTARGDAALLALEVAEFNPYLDQNNKTLALISELICAILGTSPHE
jgi:arginase